MKKADIKTGVVYAYQRNGTYAPQPVVFLSTDLYTDRGRYSANAAALTPALAGEKPGKDYLGRHTGCPVVLRAFDFEGPAEDVAPALLAATLDGAIAGKLPAGVKCDVLTTLTRIRGLYDEVLAEYQRQQDAEAQRRRVADDLLRGRRERAAQIVAQLEAFGVFATYRGHLELTLENAEKLTALLPDHKPEEGNR
jgi:hypothetical protein